MTTAKLFLTDYASYNEGKQFEFGHWIDLDQFTDGAELEEYITNHLEEADKKSPLDEFTTREEPMFTDFEGFPENLYAESLCSTDLQKIYDYIEIIEEIGTEKDEITAETWISLHNQYNENNNYSDNDIYNFDDEFFKDHFSDDPMRVAQAVFFGKINNWSDQFIMFNGYGNLESISNSDYEIESHIDKNAIWEDILENKENYNL